MIISKNISRLRRTMFRTAVLFLFAFAGGSYGSDLLDRVVAVVNKEVITWSELYRAMEF